MRVLIVDDDSTTAELTAECLMMDPTVSVRIAGDGADALRAAADYAPDVVLLDVNLPDISGLDLAPQLKSACPDTPARIVIFSGSVQDGAPISLPEGADAWLTKPAHLSALLECIFASARSKKV